MATIVESILTKNPCYTAGRKITVKGLMIHSVGVGQPDATVFTGNWNKESYDRACVHAFIDANDGIVYQTLPWNHRGWHAGADANNTHIGVEMCEPANIRYTGGASFTCSDPDKAREAVKRTYESAVSLFAMLCREYDLDPMKDGVILSHYEGGKRGIASEHEDPEHIWNGLKTGYTMAGFRRDIAAAMGKAETAPEQKEEPKPEMEWKVGDVVEFRGTTHFVSSNASSPASCKAGQATVTKIAPGAAHPYHLIATREGTSTVYGWVNTADIGAKPANGYLITVTAAGLNVRKGPGTTYDVVTVIPRGGAYTIVETRENWGRLKSGIGWICLDYTKKIE